MLTLERAKELNDAVVTEEHLRIHAINVMAAMGAMAEHFGEDKEHWMAIGYLHDYGKGRPEWQRYMETGDGKETHSMEGTAVLFEKLLECGRGGA